MSDYSVEEILQAKRVAKEAGYTVSLPDDRIEQAKNIAKANGYNVRKVEDPTEIALQVAREHGFQVVPPNPNQTRTTPTPAPQQNVPPAQPKPQSEMCIRDRYSWSERQAAKYL